MPNSKLAPASVELDLSKYELPRTDYVSGFEDAIKVHAAMAWDYIEECQAGIDDLEFKRETSGLTEFERGALSRGYAMILILKKLREDMGEK